LRREVQGYGDGITLSWIPLGLHVVVAGRRD
jgi:hypothetical protein